MVILDASAEAPLERFFSLPPHHSEKFRDRDCGQAAGEEHAGEPPAVDDQEIVRDARQLLSRVMHAGLVAAAEQDAQLWIDGG